ncbi:hypothetical protein Tco_0558591 [Tanacetum coccineum]
MVNSMNRKKNTKLDDAITGEAKDFWSTHGMALNTTTDTSTPSDVLRLFTPPSQQGDEHDIVRQLPVTPFNHAYLCLDCKDCVIRPETISFPNSRQENRPPNDLPAEHSPGHTRSTHNEVNATNKNLSTNVHRRKTTHSLPTAMSKEALSNRNTKRRSISASKRTPRNINHPPVNSQTVRPNPEHCGPSYMDLGDCDQQCRHCGCLFWCNERLKGSRYSRRVEYHLCYEGGKMYMHPAPDPQVLVQQLLRNSHFMEHIRSYNQMFSMMSFGEKNRWLSK